MAKIEVVIDGDQVPGRARPLIEVGGTGYTDPETPEPSVTTAKSVLFDTGGPRASRWLPAGCLGRTTERRFSDVPST